MIIIHNSKRINLTNNDFVSEGGEGRVFAKGSILYKLFHKKPIPQQKIIDLSELTSKNIMNPLDPIYDQNKKYIGFSMTKAPESVILCQLFTNTFWNKHNINTKTIVKLVKNLQDTISIIHKKNCLIVDANEFNFLVDSYNHIDPYFIDVDSYQTKNYPATAIMDSIRDWSTKSFSELTDWFSFAILACQLFIGIHPFKGKHPKFPKKDLKSRMLGNISVFNAETRIPASTRDFSHIPAHYKDWFIDMFENGNRSLPPSEFGILKITTKQIKIIEGKEGIIINLIKEYQNNITNFYSNGFNDVVVCNNEYVVFVENSAIKVSISGNKLIVHDSTISTNINSNKLFVSGNMLFSVYKDKVTEISIKKVGSKLIAGAKTTWNILPYASKILDGFVYQDILGVPHLSFFYNNNGKANHWITSIPELKGYKIVDGKYENRVCIIIAHKDGKYHEFILKIDKGFFNYSCSITKDVDNQEINITVLPKGLAIILDDKKLRLFTNDMNSDKEKIIEDGSLNSNMRICHSGDNVRFFIDNKLYSMRMGK